MNHCKRLNDEGRIKLHNRLNAQNSDENMAPGTDQPTVQTAIQLRATNRTSGDVIYDLSRQVSGVAAYQQTLEHNETETQTDESAKRYPVSFREQRETTGLVPQHSEHTNTEAVCPLSLTAPVFYPRTYRMEHKELQGSKVIPTDRPQQTDDSALCADEQQQCEQELPQSKRYTSGILFQLATDMAHTKSLTQDSTTSSSSQQVATRTLPTTHSQTIINHSKSKATSAQERQAMLKEDTEVKQQGNRNHSAENKITVQDENTQQSQQHSQTATPQHTATPGTKNEIGVNSRIESVPAVPKYAHTDSTAVKTGHVRLYKGEALYSQLIWSQYQRRPTAATALYTLCSE